MTGTTDREHHLERKTSIEAETLFGLQFTDEQREMMLLDLDVQIDRARAIRAVDLPNALGPAEVFDPRPAGFPEFPAQRPPRYSDAPPGDLPASDDDIAFAPLTDLSRWIASGALSSARLTEIYLGRIGRFAASLQCMVTVTAERAAEQAARADSEIAAGRYRGPLHGIPWGAKDLFDTNGIPTTWGAAPWKDRVAERDATAVRLLEEAGAVLIAKTSLGALAYGDVWFGGQTRNPWNLEEGSGGSSAGSASAVAAGLCGFALGTETLGSIVSPSMRCGATGLRPTFGRVSRTGAMALCWSLDKVGPICRRVEDTAMVLSAINAFDAEDPGSIDASFNFDASAGAGGADLSSLRIGYDPAWFEHELADPLDCSALEVLRACGARLEEIRLPDLPWDSLWLVLAVESAAAFEELTLSGRDRLLTRQDSAAWPNLFRKARMIAAVDYVQAQRLRRLAMQEMHRIYTSVDAIIGPSFAGPMQTITNLTGHPALTLRTGFTHKATRAGVAPIGALGTMKPAGEGSPRRVPHGITLWGRLFDEGTLCNLGSRIERELDVWHDRPELQA